MPSNRGLLCIAAWRYGSNGFAGALLLLTAGGAAWWMLAASGPGWQAPAAKYALLRGPDGGCVRAGGEVVRRTHVCLSQESRAVLELPEFNKDLAYYAPVLRVALSS